MVAGAVAVVALVAHVLAGPLFWLETKTWPAERSGDTVVVAIESVVKSVDPSTQTVRVASGFLGLFSRAIVVDARTRIAVGQKLGALADLQTGQLVRISYQVGADRLLASRIRLIEPGAPELPFPADPDPAMFSGLARGGGRSSSAGARPPLSLSAAPSVPAAAPPAPVAPKPAPGSPSSALASGRVAPPAVSPKATQDRNGAAAVKKPAAKPPRVTATRPRTAEPRRSVTPPAAPRVEPTSASSERASRLDRDPGPR